MLKTSHYLIGAGIVLLFLFFFKPLLFTGAGGGCVPNIVCGEWSACTANNEQVRTCEDINGCGSAETIFTQNSALSPFTAIVSASKQNLPNEGVLKVFDRITATKWVALNTKNASVLYWDVGRKFPITNYGLVSGNDAPARDPRSWKLLGSNDGQSWEVIDEETNFVPVSWARWEEKRFHVDTVKSYEYFVLNITNNGGDAHIQLAEIYYYTHNNYSSQVSVCGQGCVPDWQCGAWGPEPCVFGSTQSRICTDANTCYNLSGKPSEVRACQTGCSQSWNCSAWSICSGGSQSRVCVDDNGCGNVTGKPAETQACCSPSCACAASICSGQSCSDGCGGTCVGLKVPSWQCSAWSPLTCSYGQNQTRTCSDVNTCGVLIGKPAESQSCVTCNPSNVCGTWSICANSQRNRLCNDGCGHSSNETGVCVMISQEINSFKNKNLGMLGLLSRIFQWRLENR